MHWVFDYPWGPTLTWLAVVGALMALTASFALVWRELWPVRVSTVAMLLVRLAALALLILLLLQPRVVLERTEEVQPHVALLLDTSKSMSVVDTGTERSRLREALDALERSGLVETLGERCQLSVYEFSTGVSRLKAERLDALEEATGTGTSLGQSLAQVGDEFKGEDLAGVIVLSDGRDNTGTNAVQAAEELDVPLFTAGFGRPNPTEERERERDLWIAHVAHDKRVVVGHTTDVTVTVASKGFGARSVPLELVLGGEVLARAALALSPDRPERQVTINLKPTAPGEYVYSLRVPPDPAEANKANNEKAIPIYVTDTVARVLYIEERPRWDFKFISRVLRAYRNVEYTAIVRTAPDRPPKVIGTNLAESAQIATMKPEQLRRLKAIIIGDVPRTFFTSEQLGAIAALVDEGVAVMLLAGQDSFGAKGFAGTPLARVLPVGLLPRASYAEQRFRVEMTEEGKAHPAFQSVDHDWSRAPELISLVRVGEPRPGATVLLRTVGSRLPVAVAHRYGKGKAAVVLSDSTWRWRLGMAEGQIQDDLQAVFWRQLISWLMPEEQEAKEKRAVQVVAEKLRYELNEPVRLTVTAVDAEGKAVRDAKVVCHVTAPDDKVIERRAVLSALGAAGDAQAEGYVATFPTHVGGKYRVVVTARAGGVDLGRDEIAIFVGDTSIEMIEVDPDRELLKTLATSTKGEYYESEEIRSIPNDLVLKTKTSGWTEKEDPLRADQLGWWIFLGFVGLVAVEWVIRRTRQLE